MRAGLRIQRVVQRLRACRRERRLDGRKAGVCDRRRRQAGVLIGVVGTVDLCVLHGEHILVLRQDVHDRRVDLQRHARRDTVIDDGGDHRTLIVVGGFLFDHGRDRDDLLHRHAALIRLFEHFGRDAVVEVLKEFVDGA